MKKMSFIRCIIVNGVIIIISLLCLYGLYHSIMFGSGGRVESDISTKVLAKEKLDNLSGMMGIPFPQSTILLNILEDKSKDIVFSFKIKIDASNFDGFLSAPPFKEVRFEPSEVDSEHYFINHTDLDWWEVNKVQNWKTGVAELPKGIQSCSFLIDYDHQDLVIVYFVYFVTP